MFKIYSTTHNSDLHQSTIKEESRKTTKTSVELAWDKLFEKYDIVNKIEENRIFYISAAQIKEFKEPRLMAKFDSSQQLPSTFRDAGVNILPISRSGYVLGKFELYKEFPSYSEQSIRIKKVNLPFFETLKVNNITSESNAINALLICNILDDFLGEKGSVTTFDGRMGTGDFGFKVKTKDGYEIKIDVDKAQCEVDAGLENAKSIIILEAKNVVLPDFHVRQLYYPYRMIKDSVTKPIRLVYSVYSNHIFRLYEYRFKEWDNYSSIEFVQQQFYSIQDIRIYPFDLQKVFLDAKVLYDDNSIKIFSAPPFVQADSFERVISLMECLYNDGMTKLQIADYMQFNERQADYYFNAGRYLGLFESVDSFDEDGNQVVKRALTQRGLEIYHMNYKDRQLALVSAMLEHKIFYDLVKLTLDNGNIPERNLIADLLIKNGIINSRVTAKRRTSTVLHWLRWIFNLTNVSETQILHNF